MEWNTAQDEMGYLTNLAKRAAANLSDKSLRDLAAQAAPSGEPDGALRAQIYSALALLWAIHRRVSGHRRTEGISSRIEGLLSKIEKLLPKNYDRSWRQPASAGRR
jgi:hypothetical protein